MTDDGSVQLRVFVGEDEVAYTYVPFNMGVNGGAEPAIREAAGRAIEFLVNSAVRTSVERIESARAE